MEQRFVGIDAGAGTLKLVELVQRDGRLELEQSRRVAHDKDPIAGLRELLDGVDWQGVAGATATGRFSRLLSLPRVPSKQAQATGFRHRHGDDPATIVSIGSHGFSVLELRASGIEVFRENSRCSQGTGNFLGQLVERFGLTIEAASELCADVADPAPLSGRCPVILKTDMTHLANKGEERTRILAGLYDAVGENVQVLIKPSVSPRRVLLTGGVTISRRVQQGFQRFATKHQMDLMPWSEHDLFIEALGCAVLAAEVGVSDVPAIDALVDSTEPASLERVPALAESLSQIKRMPPATIEAGDPSAPVLLGLDIGSTGSKAVVLDPFTREVAWEGYRSTSGDPVGAAQGLVEMLAASDAGERPVIGFGVTGSGREIVGSLLSTCYAPKSVYVLNEIAAHAEGARYYDPRVDTIFEIGGQDAKYIRLADGRVVDAAMNEACSAGTGSFIEEQGKRFGHVRDVVHLGQEAMAADFGVSLGQHCSVFMAEVIDEAIAAGVAPRAIIAGIYDSIIQNYLNRVKGSRSVGDVIFCQGMPFSADALAAAVAHQTGSEVIVPPNPGTVGALGIGLLGAGELALDELEPLDLERFLNAHVAAKETFVCKATKGCGGGGNKCRIDRLRTVVDSAGQTFTWGGGCSLWDRGTGKIKLPDLAPDPFRERESLMWACAEPALERRGRPRIGITDEFALKGSFPFFATFLYHLGFDLEVSTGADQSALKRGIEEANVPFCAPMQQYHGLVSALAEKDITYLFLPMFRSTPRSGDEEHAVLCPIVQASPDMLRLDLPANRRTRIISPVIDYGAEGTSSDDFVESCRLLATSLGVTDSRWDQALRRARKVQREFEVGCEQLGREALAFAQTSGVVPVVVLGRPYTIYNKVLNSNVPALLREQGVLAIPIDCYPIDQSVPTFEGVFWGYGQRNLRAAKQVRATDGVYSLWCSNYSCGPDSFNLHFFGYLMEGKPYAVIETDGHSGDAGTKTRIEAFLHCVRQDLETQPRHDELLDRNLDRGDATLESIRARRERVLIPRMGPGAEGMAACLRGVGIPAEALPEPNRESVRIGRRYTSGKECVPMTITLGSLLQRLDAAKDGDERFAFFMPAARGPCRFGVYNLLHRIVLERVGYQDRVRLWTPDSEHYFGDLPSGFTALAFTSFAASDMLQAALYDARPVECVPGAADALFRTYQAELMERLEQAGSGDLSAAVALLQVANGRLFGCTSILKRAAQDFARIKRTSGNELPTVLLVGEIYVRLDPFSNDFVIDKLEERGLRVRFAPFGEWLEYVDYLNLRAGRRSGFGAHLSSFVQRRVQARTYGLMAGPLGWPKRTSVKDTVEAGQDYLRFDLWGEAILTTGGPVHEWREGLIDGAISAGPLECMPSKVAEAQLFHAAEREGLPSLTIALNGDPLDPEILDNFAYEVRSRAAKARQRPQLAKRIA